MNTQTGEEGGWQRGSQRRRFTVLRVQESANSELVRIDTVGGPALDLTMDDYVSMMINAAIKAHVPLNRVHPEGMVIEFASDEISRLVPRWQSST